MTKQSSRNWFSHLLLGHDWTEWYSSNKPENGLLSEARRCLYCWEMEFRARVVDRALHEAWLKLIDNLYNPSGKTRTHNGGDLIDRQGPSF